MDAEKQSDNERETTELMDALKVYADGFSKPHWLGQKTSQGTDCNLYWYERKAIRAFLYKGECFYRMSKAGENWLNLHGIETGKLR